MPEIKQFPKMRVAYVAEVGPTSEAVKRGFDKLFAWIGAQNVQLLCVPVADGVQGSGDVQIKNIGDLQVATIVYQGDANIMSAYNEIYDWLRAQGYRDAGAPMETYLSKLGEELRAEIAVPIVKMELLPAPKKRAANKPARKLAKKPAKKPAKQAKKK
jgi:DNA gyrase inhibitor GyrI